MHDYGDVIWDGAAFVPKGRGGGVKGLEQEVQALRMIFLVNQRAGFEFVVTEAGLREVRGRNHSRYTQWVHDVRATWLMQSADEEIPSWGRKFDHPSFGNVSKSDRILLQDALDFRCDAFMTMEQKLPKNADFIERQTGLRVMRPTTYWALLKPSAALYY